MKKRAGILHFVFVVLLSTFIVAGNAGFMLYAHHCNQLNHSKISVITEPVCQHGHHLQTGQQQCHDTKNCCTPPQANQIPELTNHCCSTVSTFIALESPTVCPSVKKISSITVIKLLDALVCHINNSPISGINCITPVYRPVPPPNHVGRVLTTQFHNLKLDC
jgi:hypothetical protein